MSSKLIRIENRAGYAHGSLQKLMRLVPEKDQSDQNLRRLIAFRLHLDGEASTTEYLVTKIREVVRCAYRGSLLDFLRNDRKARACFHPQNRPDPPDVA